MSEDVDRADLQRDLDRIKDAMGIADRYENAPEQWLGFGVVVAVACAISQFVVLERLPAYWFFVIWGGLFAAFGAVLHRRYGYAFEPGSTRPNVGFQILVVYAATFAVQFVAAPFLPELEYTAESAYVLGTILVLLGTAYVVAGETMKAYHIRDRDRYAFHAGGAVLAALGVTIPAVDVLHEWGFAAFGGVYLTYSLGSYWVLTRA